MGITVTPNGQIHLCDTLLEKDSLNQLNFDNQTYQLNYFNSCIVQSFNTNDYTYIKKDNMVKVGANIDSICHANYLYYRNDGFPNAKIYFCFITNMEYVNENCTAITFETDSFQTYQFDIHYEQTFIEREHTDNDAVGLHTVPEDVETGEYICNEHYKDSTMDNYSSDLCYVMASSSQPISGEAKDTIAGSKIYNGIYTGLTYYEYQSSDPIDTILEIFARWGKTSAINGIFMAPKWLAPSGTLREVNQSNSPASFDIAFSKQTTLNGYTPRNNKLLCFPFNYLVVSNNVGQNAILHYEKFSTNQATFKVRGVLNPGCSINLTPTNYNGNTYADNEAIQLGKFPICNFQNDMYTNWLTQNSINVLGQTITSDDINIVSSALSGFGGTLGSVANGDYGNAIMAGVSGIQGVANSVMQQKQHNMIPPTISGQLNSADVNVASGNNTFHFYKMSIKDEYAVILDAYFDMYGYKVNSLKIPNINSRRNWNFIKTIDCNLSGSIPQEDMQKIKNMFNSGVTIWHNPSTMYEYNQPNPIV